MSVDANGKTLPKGIRQRKDGRYEGRFTYKGENYTLYNTNLKLLQRELADRKYEVEHGLYAKETDLTVDAWFSAWLENYKKSTVKYGTYKLYLDEYRTYIKNTLGKKRLKDVRSDHIQKLLNEMAYKYSRNTVNLVRVILNSMYKQAVKNGMVYRNPVDNTFIKKEKGKKEISVMSVEEQKLFLRYAKDTQYYAVYVVALGTGMRNGEIRALRWTDVDFEKKVIHVNGTLKYIAKAENKYLIDAPKSASSRRDIPMLEHIMNTLKEHRKQQLSMRMLLGNKWRPQAGLENLVFTGRFGRCVTETALYNDMRDIGDKIRADGHTFGEFHPHSLRHTFATRGLEQGIPPKVMQEILGHTSITMTMDIYSHVLPDKKAAEMDKLAALF